MKKEAIAHGVWGDLASRNDNWDKLDGVPEKVSELDESRTILKNEIVNGDFSDGTVGWAFLGGTSYVSEGVAELLVTELIPGARIQQVLPPIIGDIYYVSGHINPPKKQATYIQLGGVNTYPIEPMINTWTRISGNVTTISKNPFRLYQRTDIVYAIGDKILFKNMFAINLTQIFGAGNEPTKEEMDIIIDTIGYFNGSHTITSKEQFNILLKMVRENTLATTSLGGGF